MLKVIRFLGNIILASMLSVVSVTLVLLGYGRAMVDVWQMRDLAQGQDQAQWLWEAQQPVPCYTWGPADGTPLVLVHGADVGGSAVWAPVAVSLGRAGYRVIAVDLAPFGHASRDLNQDLSVRGRAEVLAAALGQLGVPTAVVVGEGRGAAVALQLALKHPEVVHSLVLVGPQLDVGLSSVERVLARLPLLNGAIPWLVHGGGPVWQVLLRVQVSTVTPAYRAYAKAAREASQVKGTVPALMALYELDPATDRPVGLKSLRVPCLVLRGDRDRIVSADEAAEIASQTKADVLTIEDAGHLVSLDQPEALRSAIVQAFKR